MSDVLSIIYNMLGQLWNFVLPIGVSFGVIIAGCIGIPLVYKWFKKLFN